MRYDVAIIGGGIVGCAFALALSHQTDLSIVIIEASAQTPTWKKSEYHHRVSAITLASQQIFKSLNVWDAIAALRVSAFENIEVWDDETNAYLKFQAAEIAKTQLGFIIENNVILSALRNQLKQYSNICFLPATSLEKVEEDDASVSLITANGEVIQATCAVAADGAFSWLREKIGISVDRNPYQQHAIVATVKTKVSHQKTARQVFLKSGPLAFLPLDEPYTSSIVWTVPEHEVDQWMTLDEDLFKKTLAEKFENRLGEIVSVSKRHHFPLMLQQADVYQRHRVALLGDAAHVMHPLAGQGVNIGLLDAMSLAEVMCDSHEAGLDIAGKKSMRRYERWRRADNAQLMMGVDAIKKMFASESSLIKQLRSKGIAIIKKILPIKRFLIRHAVGERDGLPLLARCNEAFQEKL